MSIANTMPGYTVGEKDERPWGSWEVLETGTEEGTSGTEEYCIKKITVIPGGILSLQSHTLRREEWTVLEGEIQVTRDNDVLLVRKGEAIHIPMGSMHRMANHGKKKAVVREIQRGTCREDDIVRYEDAYGRETNG